MLARIPSLSNCSVTQVVTRLVMSGKYRGYRQWLSIGGDVRRFESRWVREARALGSQGTAGAAGGGNVHESII